MSMRSKLIAAFFLIVLTAIGIFIIVTLRQTALEVNNFITRRGLTGSEVVVSELEEYFATHGSWRGVAELLRSSPQIPRGMWGQQIGRDRALNPDEAMIHLRLVDPLGIIIAQT